MKEIIYYGKKNKNTGEKEETVKHLLAVGELAAQYGDKFNHKKITKVLGLFHDIGKNTQYFQDVLDGKLVGIDHAWTSGIFAYNFLSSIDKGNEYFNIFPPRTKLIIYFLSCIIASHHSNLELLDKDMLAIIDDFVDMNILRTVGGKIKKLSYQSPQELINIENYIKKYNLLENININENDYLNITNISKNFKDIQMAKEILEMIYLRILFSCLIDADYTASALFEDKNYIDKSKGMDLNPSKMIDKLNKYRKQFTSCEGINELRNRVYNDAWDAGVNNKNLFSMTAPTGTAKTLAMLGFALRQALAFQKDRIIIVLPYLSIISQTTKILKNIFGEDMVLEIDSQTEYNEKTRLQSERWTSPIIVTTSVSFFSTIFSSKPTELRKLHRIANSIVCFDEFQTLPNNVLTSTLNTLYFIGEYFNTKILLSSATKPSYEYRKNTIWHPEEIIKDVEKLYKDYDKIRKIDVTFSDKEDITEEELYNYFKPYNNSCVIFNTIKATEKYYNVLLNNEENDSVFIITSRMCSQHKLDTIKKIQEKRKRGERVLVASTQTIEVGVDIDFEYVGREYAPYDAVVQSAGRCNRNALMIGHMLVFSIEENKYPSDTYKRSTQTTKYLAKKYNININDLKFMDLYYQEEFNINKQDDENLINSIKNKDFIETEKNYKLIDNNQYQVIVPYCKTMDNYNQVLQDIQRNQYKITKQDIKRSKLFTVNVYSKNDVIKIATPLYFSDDIYDTHWYILENLDYYDDKKGLLLDNKNQGLFY